MKILIVGAGIAGLSMARALQKSGLMATIIEKDKALSQQGAGIALPANATSALDYLGLKNDLNSISHQVKEIIYAKPSGKLLSRASLLDGKLGYSEFVALKRNDLLNLLHSDELKIKFNCSIESIENRKDGVSTKLTNGEEQTWDLVIAADGINSTVSKLCFGANKPKEFNIANWRFVSELDTKNIELTYYLGKNTLFMIYPISDSKVYCYAHLCNSSHSKGNNAKEVLLKEFKSYVPMVKDLIQRADNDEIISSQLKSVSKIKYYDNRIVFIGDASNACSPLLQQGAASALEDAISLANMLKNYPVSKALHQHKAFREPRVSWIVNKSDKPLDMMVNGASLLTIMLRNILIRKKGPLNVQGWRELFKEDPIKLLKQYMIDM